jgi:hypothetical protein
MEQLLSVGETLQELRSELCAELRGETDGLARAGLRAAIRGIDDITADEQACPDGTPIRPYDQSALTLPDADLDDESEETQRSAASLYAELMEFRYSADEPRKPNGQFGKGDDDTHHYYGKRPGTGDGQEQSKADKNFANSLAQWQLGNPFLGQMKQEIKDKLKTGKEGSNRIVREIRYGTVKDTAIYRGMADLSQRQLDQYTVGKAMQIIPASFSKDLGTADFVSGKGSILLTVERGDKTIHGIDVNKWVKPGNDEFVAFGKMANEPAPDFSHLREVICGGHFQVTGRSTRKDGTTLVTLRQTDVF